MTIYDAYIYGRDILNKSGYGDGEVDARVLLCHVLGITKEYFYAYGKDVDISSSDWEKYTQVLRLRLARFPVAYIIGKREFMGLEFKVTPSVLIPRPSTELLVEVALGHIGMVGLKKPKIADICTGCGNVAISLGYYYRRSRIWATDISFEALQVAEENLKNISSKYPYLKLDERITFIQGDGVCLPEDEMGSFDIIVANPPYVTEDEWESLMDGVRIYEPKIALVPPTSPEKFYRKIISEASFFLKKGGFLAVEIGISQRNMVIEILREEGFVGIMPFQDLESFWRVVTGKLRRVKKNRKT